MERSHLEIVGQGPAYLARWRRDHPDQLFNLSGADLTGINLSLADLRLANLEGIHGNRVSFLEANLMGARMTGISLRETTLQGAYLAGASVVGAKLEDCDLTWTHMEGTLLDGCQFQNVSVNRASWGATSVAGSDVSRLVGIEFGSHSEPSSVGIDTLALTLQGNGGIFSTGLKSFFLDAGVPKSLLDYLPSLLESQPIQFFSCFISFGGDDALFADKLYRDLRKEGIRCWKYDEDAIIGRGVWMNIDRAISAHEKVIVVCSESSLKRPGVEREIERALQREDAMRRDAVGSNKDSDVLVPIRVDDYVLSGWEHPRQADLVAKHIGDFRRWDQEDQYARSFRQLLRALDPKSLLKLQIPSA